MSHLRKYAPTIAAIAVFVALYIATRPSPPPRPPPLPPPPRGLEIMIESSRPLEGKTLDLDLHEATIESVFRLLGEMSGKSVHLDDGVRGTVDVRFAHVPLQLAYDAIAARMGLSYEERDGSILVHCAARDTSDERLAARVTIDAHDAGVEEVASHVASAAKLVGVDWRASSHPQVTITMTNVRASTALAALAETSGLKMHAAGGKIVVENR